ncbi:hypothetical protein FISHEDRAFT_39431, partial [Fistulina hepatica ATCC 64428]
RVFRPVSVARFRIVLLRLRSMFKSPTAKVQLEDDFFMEGAPIGADPFTATVPLSTRAHIAKSDYNHHLSNSSYAQDCDCARFKTYWQFFKQFARAGGWMPLAGTHYQFIREIPMFATYEVRTLLGAWDEKWIYIVSRFVSRSTKGRKERKALPASMTTSTHDSKEPTATINLIHTPANVDTESPSPVPSGATSPEETARSLRAVSAGLGEEKDGSILHAVTVSQMCYKIGRITIPPAIVLAISGFCDAPAEGGPRYSVSHPPPYWPEVLNLTQKSLGGGPKVLHDFLVGGWRNVPECDRWWEQAMSGKIEEQRRANLAQLEAVKSSMEAVRQMRY